MKLELIEHQCLWENQFHNAFTDLIRYEDKWYCAFREGSTHMSLDGRAHILVSDDGQEWQSLGFLRWAGGDVRDPKFSVDNSGKLVINVGVRLAVFNDIKYHLFSTAWVFNKHKFAGPYVCDTSNSIWRWRVAWHQGQAYSVSYAGRDLAEGCLYISDNGLNWRSWQKPFFPPAQCFSNEAALAFGLDDMAYCVLRRDLGQNCTAMLGTARSPYHDWQWSDLGVRVGGPGLLVLSSGEVLLATRMIDEQGVRTVVARLLPNAPEDKLDILLTLPSYGDTGYPGLVEHQGVIWLSYYSSHQGKSAIYLARLKCV